MQMIVAFDIFVDAGVLGHFNVGERAFMMWISKVASHYRDNPYHNFQHVVHVLHAVYMILMTTEASKCLTRVDQLALLIAALCHDIDHDGAPPRPRSGRWPRSHHPLRIQCLGLSSMGTRISGVSTCVLSVDEIRAPCSSATPGRCLHFFSVFQWRA